MKLIKVLVDTNLPSVVEWLLRYLCADMLFVCKNMKIATQNSFKSTKIKERGEI